ncbi:MAG: hypothetical protein B7733_22075 [Myxococcales bacterium FL481]|nr:MAG: hypothetical protein B7733_22075 [Myxococcales bacterium FL481]
MPSLFRRRARCHFPFGRWCLLALITALWDRESSANPGGLGSRHLGMANTGRASAVGVDAALVNPAALTVTPMFELETQYQVRIIDRTHGLGVFVTDSLNNPSLAIGLGYLFTRGRPLVRLPETDGGTRELELSRFGHQAALPFSVVAVPGWLALGGKLKYQYLSLRYLDDEGIARDAHDKLEAFGLDVSLMFVGGRWLRFVVLADNLSGHHPAPYDALRELSLDGVERDVDGEIDYHQLRRISEYPLALTHALAVYPLGSTRFSLNVDATYDLASYADQGRARPIVGGSGEIQLGPIPVRVGSFWDGGGRGRADDRVVVSGGVAYQRDAKPGGWGADMGLAFSQQVSGEHLATVIGVNLGLRLHPDR